MNTTTTSHKETALSRHTKKLEISDSVKEKTAAAKAFIQDIYESKRQEHKQRQQALNYLEKRFDSLGVSQAQRDQLKKELMHLQAEKKRQLRQKQSVRQYEPLKIIGRGAFGEVRLCRCLKTGSLVAVKKMKKKDMVMKNQVAHIKAERDILAKTKNPYIVNLRSSFQDENNLYLVMDYHPGGDLMTLLIRKDILSEQESRFYISELILAVESVHKLGYIHRDLKPDNILLDAHGHVKLSDFGLCKHTEIKGRTSKAREVLLFESFKKGTIDKKEFYKKRRAMCYSVVGTPDYIAPEVFGQGGYLQTVDWWSVGVILFEMLVGYPPFFAEEPSITCQKILNWKKTLLIPPEANLSPAATDLLKRLITDHDLRLGKGGAEEIKSHPFFEGVDWAHILDIKAPNVTKLSSEIDTQNFDPFDEQEPFYPPPAKRQLNSKKEALNYFHNFTYNREAEEEFKKIWTDEQLSQLLALVFEPQDQKKPTPVLKTFLPQGHALLKQHTGDEKKFEKQRGSKQYIHSL